LSSSDSDTSTAPSLLENLLSLASVIEAKDPYTAGHAWRVAAYGRVLGASLGFVDEASQFRLTLAGYLHDVGKLTVPDGVLTKRGPLSEDEIELIRRHPSDGFDILRFDPIFEEVLDVVLMHHEAVDGSGYPSHLRGKEIPIDARLFAVVDTFDALTSNRPYRQPCAPQEAMAVLLRLRGQRLDAEAVDKFVRLFEVGKLAGILGHCDEDTPVGHCPTCGPTIELRRFHKPGDRVACRVCKGVFQIVHREAYEVEIQFTGTHLGQYDKL
jgi:HD-GYP domain-containing protein (c-di-GMP phosphodiesterase class II)